MIRKLSSNHGETFAEVLVAIIVMVLALSILLSSLSIFSPPKNHTVSKPTQGVVRLKVNVGEISYETDMDIIFNEEGYEYAKN